MIQLNLLPDVKLDFIRAKNRKKNVITISVVISAIFFSIFILLLLFVRVGQKQHMKAVDKDIDSAVATLKKNSELDNILTVQNQLASLPGLHEKKNISSRTFDFLSQVTPTNATISDLVLDFDAGTINIKGNADSLSTVNKFVDTLKFTKFRVAGQDNSEKDAFSEVVLKSFSVENSQSGGKIAYEIEMKFDPLIYSNSAPSTDGGSPVTFTVPSIISTRSATQSPEGLFQERAGDEQ